MTWLTGWNYRKTITISNAGSSLTDYQVLAIIDTASLITVGKLLSSCNDIRFTSSDGSTLLNYWIESGINTSSTRIWIKIPSISIGSSTIYLYYNNPSASSTSDITNVMIFGDDFSSDLSKWSGDTAYFTISNGELTNTPTSNGRIIYQNVPLTNTIITARIKTTDTSSDLLWGLGYRIDASNRAYLARRNVTPSNLRRWGDGSRYYSTIPPQWTSGTYGIDKIIVRTTVASSTHSFNDTTITGIADFSVDINNGISIKAYGTGTPGVQYMDWVHIRKYVPTEPTTCIGGEEISSVSWLSGWNRRKLITITGSTSSSQTDYQMKLTVHKSSGTDTSTDIYAGTNINNDFSDLRFTSNDGSTLLNYWIESFSSGSIATVWVKIPLIPISPCTSTIYLYYDKPSATTTSNGNNTFEFFDDFDSIDILKWNNTDGFSQSGSEVYTSGTKFLKSLNDIGIRNRVFEFKMRIVSPTYPQISGIRVANQATSSQYYGFVERDNGVNGLMLYKNDAGSPITSGAPLTVDSNYHRYILIFPDTSNIYGYYEDGNQKTISDSAYTTGKLYILVDVGTGTVYFDRIFVRKIILTEPTISLIESEETLAAPANITATSLIITPSETPCRQGICTVIVDVIWTNAGGITGSFTPSIKIDNAPVIVSPPLGIVTLGPSETMSQPQRFIITGLATGIHNICPDPN